MLSAGWLGRSWYVQSMQMVRTVEKWKLFERRNAELGINKSSKSGNSSIQNIESSLEKTIVGSIAPYQSFTPLRTTYNICPFSKRFGDWWVQSSSSTGYSPNGSWSTNNCCSYISKFKKIIFTYLYLFIDINSCLTWKENSNIHTVVLLHYKFKLE